MKDIKENPLLLLALAIGIPLGIAAALWGIAQIFVAIGTAAGIVVGMFSAGPALGGVVEIWATRTAAFGLAAGGGAIAYKTVVNVTQQVKNDTFAWTLPIIAILVGLLVEIDKEFYATNPIIKHFLSAVFASIMLVGGYLFTKKSKVVKVCAFLLMLLPPIVIFLIIVSNHSAEVLNGFSVISAWQWFTIISIICLTILIALLGTYVEKNS